MINSMTAFSRKQAEGTWGSLTWELKAVNHRYLDVVFKLPEGFRHLEQQLRLLLQQAFARGKVEASLKINATAAEGHSFCLNKALVQELFIHAAAIKQINDASAPISTDRVLLFPGVLQAATIDEEKIAAAIKSSFTELLKAAASMRITEGENIKAIILSKNQALQQYLIKLQPEAHAIGEAIKSKLQTKIKELAVKVDSLRFEQEVALLAQKYDITEEIDRLIMHAAEVTLVLEKGGPCGRKLDFLMQELHREANTLSAKASSNDLSANAVELKVLIEQMREQVQNLE